MLATAAVLTRRAACLRPAPSLCQFGVVSAVVEKATGNRFAIKSISKEWAQDQGWTEVRSRESHGLRGQV